MLVLTRKKQETVVVGDNIKITIAEIRGDSVKLAIDAPKEVKIYRAEIYQAIAKENQDSVFRKGPEELEFLRQQNNGEKQTIEP